MKKMDYWIPAVPGRKTSEVIQACQRFRSTDSTAPGTRGFTLFRLVTMIAFLGTFTITLWGYYHSSSSSTARDLPAHDQTISVHAVPSVRTEESSSGAGRKVSAHRATPDSGADGDKNAVHSSATGHQGYADTNRLGLTVGNQSGYPYEAIHAGINAPQAPATGSQDIDIEDATRTISGKVLDQSGQPIPGAAVSATVKRFFGTSREDNEAPRTGDPGTVYKYNFVSREDGSYAFTGLADGEYLLKAAYERYLPARITVRSGVRDVNLVMARPDFRYIQGVVTNQSGHALAGVKVLPNLPSARMSESNDAGLYEAELPLIEDAAPESLFVRFKLEGYRDRLVRIGENDWNDLNQARFDIAMQPVNDVAAVAGTIRSNSGSPVSGQTVTLHSTILGNRYTTVTDSTGSFLIENIDLGDDYGITVRPRGGYKDYSYQPLSIRADLMNLNILLEPLETTVLNGQMMDTQGNPIPGFTLQLRSVQAAGHVIEVKGDYQGHFRVNDAPLDSLLFETWSSPQFRISNVGPPGKYDLLPLILDWGNHEIHGRVQNSQGVPVCASQIQLTWIHTYNGIRSVATRKTVTDAAGNFRFSQVGPGQHTLSVDAPGFQSSRLTYETGMNGNNEVLIRLQGKLL